MPTIDDGQQAIDSGNLQQARLIFEALLQENPRSEEAWLGLAEVLTDTEDKRICYDNVLKINKKNRAAREGLRSLEPQADPLIAALQQQTSGFSGEDEMETMVSEAGPEATSGPMMTPAPSAEGPPTFVLVAIGLALSVVIFALGGGLLFVLIGSMRGT